MSGRLNRTSLLRLIFCALILFAFCAPAAADTLYLKNGRVIEGLIKSEDNASIELEVGFGTIKFEKSQIEKITKANQAEVAALEEKWRQQKKETEELFSRQKQEEEMRYRVDFSRQEGIVVKATLDRKIQASLILDTGASIVALRRDIAQKLGMDVARLKPDMKMILADGRSVNAKHVIISSLSVADNEVKDVEGAIILDEIGNLGEGIDGLLGMSYLKKFNFRIDYREKRLILERY